MKLYQGWVGWASLGCVCILAACGGASESGGDGNGGGSLAGGSGNGGSSGGNTPSGGKTSGGSSSGGAPGRAGASQGGSPTQGGAPSTGGFNVGGFNVGGEGIDPADFACETPPKVGAECDADADIPCVSGLSICYCNMSKWACQSALGGGQIGEVECPATKPTTGTPCGDEVGFCPYGGQFTGCACYQGSWACL